MKNATQKIAAINPYAPTANESSRPRTKGTSIIWCGVAVIMTALTTFGFTAMMGTNSFLLASKSKTPDTADLIENVSLVIVFTRIGWLLALIGIFTVLLGILLSAKRSASLR